MMLARSGAELVRARSCFAGSPISYWAGGARGKNPMRYSGGLLGGTWLAFAHGRPRARQVRRRVSGEQLRKPGTRRTPPGASSTTCIPRSTPSSRASSSSSAGGAATTSSQGRRWSGSRRDLFVGNKLSDRRGAVVRWKAPRRHPQHPLADRGVRLLGRQHHPRRSRRFNWIPDLYRSVEEIRLNGQSDRGIACTKRSATSASSSRRASPSAKHSGAHQRARARSTRCRRACTEGDHHRHHAGHARARNLPAATSSSSTPRTLDDILKLDDGRGRRAARSRSWNRVSQIDRACRHLAAPFVKAMSNEASGAPRARPQPGAHGALGLLGSQSLDVVGESRGGVGARGIASRSAPDNPLVKASGRCPGRSRDALDRYRDVRDDLVEADVQGTATSRPGSRPRSGMRGGRRRAARPRARADLGARGAQAPQAQGRVESQIEKRRRWSTPGRGAAALRRARGTR